MTAVEFITKWRASTVKERSGAQEHFIDLCRLVDHPTPVEADPSGEFFTFEKGAAKTGGGEGWADVWKKGCFAWEYKGKHKDLTAAFAQLQRYSLALENPPLLVVSDMETIVIHTTFTNTVQEIHTLALEDLERPEVLRRLRWLFTEPERFRPGVTRSMLTEQAAQTFAGLAQSLRDAGFESRRVAHFVNKLIFCMFAEDIDLLPGQLFTRMVESVRSRPEKFAEKAAQLFAAMRDGGEIGFGDMVPWFNGGLFDDDDALPLDTAAISQLLACAKLDWSEIEPAIFGTLFERGLDPAKRSQLGAHYTDRDSIMRIVGPVVVEPLEQEWQEVKGALTPGPSPGGRGGKKTEGRYRTFLAKLRATKVLDPACGSGNFLYLALIELKNLEHRIMLEGETFGFQRDFPQIGPQNVLGIEINDYAAELARVTVWIGDIQWSIKNGFGYSNNPILKKLDTIQCRDALITPRPSGEGPGVRENSSEAAWPQADCIIGNPPFLGDKKMLAELGEDYVTQLRTIFKGRVPGGADLVTYWFEKARAEIEAGPAQRAGLVATNSIRGGANRKVLQRICASGRIFSAWSDEPWINEGAAVRVSLICFGPRSSLPPGEGPGVRARKHHQPETTFHDVPSELLQFARQLRTSQTDAENLLWSLLRNRQIDGCKFRRQHPMPPFILDFYCHEAALCIEVDGGQHQQQRDKDRNRDARLEELGIKTLRFWNNQVLQETESVLEVIWNELHRRNPAVAPSPQPSPRGRGGEKFVSVHDEAFLNCEPVVEIYPDLTAAKNGASTLNLTTASRLKENLGVCFEGIKKYGPFDITGEWARSWLHTGGNPNACPNSDVLRPWLNAMDLVRRPSDTWVVDFATLEESEAACYELPFQYSEQHVKPKRASDRNAKTRNIWWRYERPRPELRATIEKVSRYIATPVVSKHRVFQWVESSVLPSNLLDVIARDDDTIFGILHSRFHELWALRMCTFMGVGNDPRYTPTTTFETFPFPAGLTPNIPAADYADNPHAQAIAAASRRLVELRDNWLNPAEWVDRIPEISSPLPPGEGPGVRAYPDRIIPKPGREKDLAKRTLTNLYNQRPQWLINAHVVLDAAVASAYGWPPDLADDLILARLLALNQERSKEQK